MLRDYCRIAAKLAKHIFNYGMYDFMKDLRVYRSLLSWVIEAHTSGLSGYVRMATL